MKINNLKDVGISPASFFLTRYKPYGNSILVHKKNNLQSEQKEDFCDRYK